MVDDNEQLTVNEFLGARPRVLVTDAENPEDGRTFVWTKMGWFEREEGTLGDVAFTRIAESEEELKELLQEEDASIDLTEAFGVYRKTVTAEFMEQEPSVPDDADNSSEDEFEE
jgi:hypothetical protein